MTEYIDAPIREHLFKNDAKMLAEYFEREWSLTERPYVFGYEPEQMLTNPLQDRLGQIYIQMVHRSNRISTIDYKTVDRTTTVGIKVMTRYMETLYEWCDEIYRIVLANRRTGVKRLNGGLLLEITDETFTNDLSGAYAVTLDCVIRTFNEPIRSDGFGNTINREINTEDDMQ